MNSTAHTAVDSGRATEHVLNFAHEAAARSAAEELAALGHLLVAARVADERARAWDGLPAGWWQVRSVAAIVGDTDDARHWASVRTLVRVDTVARRHGGFTSGGSDGNRASMLGGFDRAGLVYEAPAGRPMPTMAVAPSLEVPVPGWTDGGSYTRSDLVDAVRAVARRLYGDAAGLPDNVDWLFDDDCFGSLSDRDAEFMGRLCEAVSSDGQACDIDADSVEFVAALAADDHVPAAERAHFLYALLKSATSAHLYEVDMMDRATALGESSEESADERAVRLAVQARVPALLAHWDAEVDAGRLLLAALATLVPESAAFVGPRLALLPAPAETRRADVIRLIHALLHDDQDDHGDHVADALDAVARWEGETAIRAATDADRRTVALAMLGDLVSEETGPTTHRDEAHRL
ncbi:hypothetical protein [Streptomyces sp. SID3343]|uniref:hypothetical protein n=1 Tax=Streptomyces sp. SID3343 TaxID=2690260 RepID=UPI001368FD0F|nr:hypothetical protein [Streptomyces sp. SID3343]MYV97084.1 hypothetical protein [Streptomyces sp. SID3343]